MKEKLDGVLRKSKAGFRVEVPSKKTSFGIRPAAQRFQLSDASDGLPVEVELGADGQPVKVTIPGKTEVVGAPTPQPPKHGAKHPGPRGGKGFGGSGDSRSSAPDATAIRKKKKASPKVLGMPFHNPYTFLPFPKSPPKRAEPTPWSADELPTDASRFTGVLELEVTTRSPLLTADPNPVGQASQRKGESESHKSYDVLRIGPDVIVPATGIRGALRTLLTVLTGGTLGHLNTSTYLCQGRDVKLGPRGKSDPPTVPIWPFLAEVLQPGNEFQEGTIRLGETRLAMLEDLEACLRHSLPGEKEFDRHPKSKPYWVELDREGHPVRIARERSDATPWRLKLSGRPINKYKKREGLLLANGIELTLPTELWSEYSGRNAHGDRSLLRKGDLIWLEPKNPDATSITKVEDIRSLQWSRWGKRGQSLRDLLAQTPVLPDYLKTDGLVDEVTNLFGQVSSERGVNAPAFAGRIRPENLVFEDAANKVLRRVTLAPLSVPHPGCAAFYRENSSADDVSPNDPLRGYKVYRTTNERGDSAPWLFQSQGVYKADGSPDDSKRDLNKTCDLVAEGLIGSLRIAFHSLTQRELALLIQACHVPWRLGGGKPLGLGLCEVRVRGLLDEEGEPLVIPDATWREEVRDIQDRVRMWTASQQPVPLLRYPRAVERNRNKLSRGGHAWFQRHALPRLVDEKGTESREPGVKPLYVDGALKARAAAAGEPLDPGTPLIAGQILPPFNADSPLADLLYGFDGYGWIDEQQGSPKQKVYLEIEPFDPTNKNHVTGTERSSGSHGKNAASRQDDKQNRSQGG